MIANLVPMIDLNPFHWLGDQVKESLADAFTSMMMALWSAALWLMDLVFSVLDRFLTPDVTDPGLSQLYGVTLWVSLVVALVIGFGQIGLAAIRRDGRTLGALAMGVVQYGAVVAGWVAVCGGLIVGCAGLTRGLLSTLLDVPGFAGYSASAGMPNQVVGTVQAAVLGICALFLVIPAAFGYLLIMLVREAALLILTATMPIAAAGALGEGTRSWMWKSVRWFVAACLTAPLLALVVGLGVQISRAAFPEASYDAPRAARWQRGIVNANAANVGMAVVGCARLRDRLLLPDGAVPAAGVRRPGHRLGRLVPDQPGRQRRRLGPVSGQARAGRRDRGPRPRSPLTAGPPARPEPTPRPPTASSPVRPRPSASPARWSAPAWTRSARSLHRRLDVGRRHGPGGRRPSGLLRHDATAPHRQARTAADTRRPRTRPGRRRERPGAHRERGRSGRRGRGRGVPRMTVYGASASARPAGLVLRTHRPPGLPRARGRVPVLAGDVGRPVAALLGLVPLWLAAVVLICVPVRGWSAAQWIGVLVRHAARPRHRVDPLPVQGGRRRARRP